MKKEFSVLMAFLMLSMALTLAKPATAAAPTYGPRADELHINIYANEVAEFAAFEAGDIDIVDTPLDPTHVEQYSHAPDNASIIVSKYSELGMYEFDVNNNETIQARPGVKTATSDMYFRAALACLADKDYIVTNILQGYAARLDGPVMPWMGDYYDPTVHTFSFDPVEAARYLALGGFTDSDSDGIINYPVGWSGREAGPNLDPLIFYIRSDDVYRRKPAGEDYVLRLQAAGIPVDDRVVPRAVTSVEVMQEHNFDLYTGGWSLSRDPDWMYYLFHADWYQHPGPDQNYNHMNDPALNGYLEDIAFATTIPDAVTATHNAQKRGWNAPDDAVPGICAHIPLWATAGYTAYRRPMAYAVNAAASGTTNGWTMLASYNTTNFYGNTIRWGFKSDVQMLNPLYSNWVWDNYVLAEIFDGTLAVNPYNLALDMPWTCSEFETTTYVNPELGECSRVILTVRDGVRFHDGVALTSQDLKFTYDYIKSFPDCWLYYLLADIVSTSVAGNQVTIDFDVLSTWALHWIMGVYILPKHIYETIPDPRGFTPGNLPAEDVLIGHGPYKWWQYSSGDYFTLLANRDYFKAVHPVGDVNIDGVCDMKDALAVIASFNKTRGQEGYVLEADVAPPFDLVTMVDVTLIFGRPFMALFTYSPEDPVVDQPVTFDASASFDPDGHIVRYNWDFGDGKTGNGKIVTHRYDNYGNYEVTLEVSDAIGGTNTALASVHVVREIKIAIHLVNDSKITEKNVTDWLNEANKVFGCSFKFVIDTVRNHTKYDNKQNDPNEINIWGVKETSVPPGYPPESKYVSERNGEKEVRLTLGDGQKININPSTLAHELAHIFGFKHSDAKGDPNHIIYPDNDKNPATGKIESGYRTGTDFPPADQGKARESDAAKKHDAAKKGRGKDEYDFVEDVSAEFVDLSWMEVWAELSSIETPPLWKLHFTLTVASFINVNCELGFFIESDNNMHTGTPTEGIDYYVGFNPAFNQTIFKRYDLDWTLLDPTGITYNFTYNDKDANIPPIITGIGLSLPLTLLDRSAGNVLRVRAMAQNATLVDQAPDTGFMTILLPNIAVTNVTPSKTVVGSGYSTPINVTIHNQGGASETFNVTLYYANNPIETQTITLTNQTLTTVTFTWNTSGFAFGNYSISAYASPVEDETEIEDNLLVDGLVAITVAGDVNGDSTVDIYDLILVASGFGTETGDPGFSPNADINGDGIIDIYDLILVAGHYGETIP